MPPFTTASSQRKKAVKGFLVPNGHMPPKTYDIRELIALAAAYATRFRYPGPTFEPSRADYEQVLADAEEVLRVTLSLIPRESHPPKPPAF